MGSEVITIEGRVNRYIVLPHRANYARLWFYAPGLEIYVKCRDAKEDFATIANIAMNEAIARHISVNSLKTVPLQENKYGGQNPPQPAASKQLLLPFDDTTKPESE